MKTLRAAFVAAAAASCLAATASAKQPGRPATKTLSHRAPFPALPQDMPACAHCGTHIPKAEALMLGKHAYCCAEHRRLGPA